MRLKNAAASYSGGSNADHTQLGRIRLILQDELITDKAVSDIAKLAGEVKSVERSLSDRRQIFVEYKDPRVTSNAIAMMKYMEMFKYVCPALRPEEQDDKGGHGSRISSDNSNTICDNQQQKASNTVPADNTKESHATRNALTSDRMVNVSGSVIDLTLDGPSGITENLSSTTRMETKNTNMEEETKDIQAAGRELAIYKNRNRSGSELNYEEISKMIPHILRFMKPTLDEQIVGAEIRNNANDNRTTNIESNANKNTKQSNTTLERNGEEENSTIGIFRKQHDQNKECQTTGGAQAFLEPSVHGLQPEGPSSSEGLQLPPIASSSHKLTLSTPKQTTPPPNGKSIRKNIHSAKTPARWRNQTITMRARAPIKENYLKTIAANSNKLCRQMDDLLVYMKQALPQEDPLKKLIVDDWQLDVSIYNLFVGCAISLPNLKNVTYKDLDAIFPMHLINEKHRLLDKLQNWSESVLYQRRQEGSSGRTLPMQSYTKPTSQASAQNFDNILQQAKHITAYYKQNKSLDPVHQRLLSDIICDSYISKGLPFSRDDMQQYSELIVSRFPSEQKDKYYSGPDKALSKLYPSGHLYNRYHYKKRLSQQDPKTLKIGGVNLEKPWISGGGT